MAYLNLSLWLLILGVLFLKIPNYRIILSLIMGVSYFLWGVFIHHRNKTLYLSVICEYLAISLLAITVLIFISLRV